MRARAAQGQAGMGDPSALLMQARHLAQLLFLDPLAGPSSCFTPPTNITERPQLPFLGVLRSGTPPLRALP